MLMETDQNWFKDVVVFKYYLKNHIVSASGKIETFSQVSCTEIELDLSYSKKSTNFEKILPYYLTSRPPSTNVKTSWYIYAFSNIVAF